MLACTTIVLHQNLTFQFWLNVKNLIHDTFEILSGPLSSQTNGGLAVVDGVNRKAYSIATCSPGYSQDMIAAHESSTLIQACALSTCPHWSRLVEWIHEAIPINAQMNTTLLGSTGACFQLVLVRPLVLSAWTRRNIIPQRWYLQWLCAGHHLLVEWIGHAVPVAQKHATYGGHQHISND